MGAEVAPAQKTGRRPGRLALFLCLTFGISAVIWVLMAFSEIVRGISFILLMWTPGVAALVTCRLRSGGCRQLGWSLRPWWYQVISFVLPALLSIIVYAMIWSTGLGALDLARLRDTGSEIALVLTFGLVASIVLALGEEIGWRGLLVPTLAERFSFSVTALASGGIWAAWHLPLILFYGYRDDAPLGSALVWGVVGMMAVSFPLAWLRLRSGSVWTAAILHGTHNILVQSVLDPLTTDTGSTGRWIGEFGCAIPLAWTVVALAVWTRHRALGPDRVPTADV